MCKTSQHSSANHPRPTGSRAPDRLRGLLAGLACLVLVILSAVSIQGTVPARADDSTPDSWNIPSYALRARIGSDGDARATLNLAFDFADDEGHGPYITFSKRQKLTDDPDHWRMIDYSDITASSPSGADATIDTEQTDAAMRIRFGSKDRDFTGVQRYRISFTVHGLIARNNAESGLDEVNWQVFNDFDVPIGRATVQLAGPGHVQRATCFNDGDPEQCASVKRGGAASFNAGRVDAHNPLQVVAGFPAGTFTKAADARLTERRRLGNTFGLNPASGIGAVVAALLASWYAVRRGRRSRDHEFVGVTPGAIPPRGQARTGPRRHQPEVAVAFQPPRGVSPAEAGTLLDGSSGDEEATAAMLDLAVRGHVRISPARTGRWRRSVQDWVFERIPQSPDIQAPDSQAPGSPRPDPLRDWESEYLDEFFHDDPSVSTATLRTEHGNTTLSDVKVALDRAVGEYGWYAGSPTVLKLKSFGIGMLVLAIGLALSVAGAFGGWGLVGVPVVVIGIVMAVMGVARAPGRTATGTAVLDQTRSFRLYLETAEADQIRFEEGIDVFSRYLPWATVFGVADRWVRIFADLEARGAYHGDYSWYGGDRSTFGTGFAVGFSSALNDMTSAMSSSMQAASSSSTSSSSSGFSGGGGFGGGGGGGW